MEKYGDGHRPLVLPCAHSVCEACVKKLPQNASGDSIGCPVCRSEHDVPDKGFPPNYSLEEAVKEKPKRNKIRYLFIGNPGTGKSTMLNCHARKCLFKSGMSFGGGLTAKLDVEETDEIIYMDTPGLADEQLRREAAKAIAEALKAGGEYKVCFVLLSTQGRVRPDDKSTMKLVLNAVPELGENFGILLNQCSRKFMQGMQEPGDKLDKFISYLFSGMDRRTSKIWSAPVIEDLQDEDDAVAEIPFHVRQFIDSLPTVQLTEGKAKGIDHDGYDRMTKAMEAMQRAMEQDRELFQQERAKSQEQLKQINEELRRVMQQAAADAVKATEPSQKAEDAAEKSGEKSPKGSGCVVS